MGLEEVVSNVVQRAEKKARKIRSDAENEAKEIVSKAEARGKDIEKKAMGDIDRQIASIRKRKLSSQQLENRKAILNMEKEAIDSIYEKAEKKLPSLGAKDKEKILAHCLERGTQSLDAKFVYCRKEDKDLVKKLAPELEVLPTLDSLGGIIVEDAYYERMENYTFESILERARESSLPDVHGLLFGGK